MCSKRLNLNARLQLSTVSYASAIGFFILPYSSSFSSDDKRLSVFSVTHHGDCDDGWCCFSQQMNKIGAANIFLFTSLTSTIVGISFIMNSFVFYCCASCARDWRWAEAVLYAAIFAAVTRTNKQFIFRTYINFAGVIKSLILVL